MKVVFSKNCKSMFTEEVLDGIVDYLADTTDFECYIDEEEAEDRGITAGEHTPMEYRVSFSISRNQFKAEPLFDEEELDGESQWIGDVSDFAAFSLYEDEFDKED